MRRSGRSHLRQLRGVMLYRSPVREQDRIVEVYSCEEGKRRLFAPGVRHAASRRAGHLEPFMETALTVVHNTRGDAVSEARVLHAFPRLREDLDRLELGWTLLGLVREHTAEGEQDPLLYDAILGVVMALDDPRPLPPLLLEGVVLHLLRSFGALPDMTRCTTCRALLRPHAFDFAGPRKGFRCENCGGRANPALTEVVKVLRLLREHAVLPRSLRLSPPVEQKTRVLLRSLLRSHAPAAGVHSRA